jgi:UDP-glucose 4-epimerase
VRLVVTGATGFLGWRTTVLLRERGHDVLAVARPGGAQRAHARGLDGVVHADTGDPAARDLVEGRDAILHFAGVPDPAGARRDPAAAIRANVGTTVNLLEGCAQHGAALVYPSSVRAGLDPPPDPYALSKRLGEDACLLHVARSAIVRLPSVFGPGQVTWEGATGAIAAFAARAIDGEPIVIPGDPSRTRDFVYVDDLVAGLDEGVLEPRRFGELLAVGAEEPTPLLRAAELVRDAVGGDTEIQLPGGELPPGEGQSYPGNRRVAGLGFPARPIEAAIADYVDWLRAHPAAQGRART